MKKLFVVSTLAFAAGVTVALVLVVAGLEEEFQRKYDYESERHGGS